MPVTDETQAEAAARSLIAKGVGTVIVTMGSRGALLVEAAQTRRIEPVSVTPVDTTGAGDAFIGAFAHFHASGEPVFDALGKPQPMPPIPFTRRGTQKSYARAADFAALQQT